MRDEREEESEVRRGAESAPYLRGTFRRDNDC